MIIVDDILVAEPVYESHFVCNLNKCKGACCVEGDFGAPLSEEEASLLDQINAKIKPFLSAESNDLLDEKGHWEWSDELSSKVTTLHEDGACVYMVRDEKGWAACGIEKAFNEEAISFQKPISCHLYPVRVKENKEAGFTALNYDQWDICNPACSLGNELQVPLYRFVKSALIRRFGQAFYDALEGAVQHAENP